jgi:hypothetical protein
MQRFHGLAAQWLTDKRFPPCLRPARRGFAQAGLKLRHLTACSDSQPKWSLVNCDMVSQREGNGEGDQSFRRKFLDLTMQKSNILI